jgi:hypothetical protein
MFLFISQPSGLVGIEAIVAYHLTPYGWDMLTNRGDDLFGRIDLEVSSVLALLHFTVINDLACRFVIGELIETKEI